MIYIYIDEEERVVISKYQMKVLEEECLKEGRPIIRIENDHIEYEDWTGKHES